jgi:hypothetical protein
LPHLAPRRRIAETTTRRFEMSLARVVAFNGVSQDRVEQMKKEMADSDPPEGLNATELIILSDPEAEQALAIVFFADEDDYRRGDEILSAIPSDDTPGARASVTRYEVAIRRTMA